MAYVVLYQRDRAAGRFAITDVLIVGRDPQCDLVIDDPSVSRRHCTIEATEAGWAVTDHDSRNGTFVGGMAIRSFLLTDGDEIRVGDDSVLEFRDGPLPPHRPGDPEEAIRRARASLSEETRVTIQRLNAPHPQPRPW